MINPYKDWRLARLCTVVLRTLGPESLRKVGQSNRKDFNGEPQGDFEKENLIDR
jgi:hypothetical protein